MHDIATDCMISPYSYCVDTLPSTGYDCYLNNQVYTLNMDVYPSLNGAVSNGADA